VSGSCGRRSAVQALTLLPRYQTGTRFATSPRRERADIGWVGEQLGHTSTEMVIRPATPLLPEPDPARWIRPFARLVQEEGF